MNDGLAYALEAWDFENFEGMVNKALVLENHRGVMECMGKFTLCWNTFSLTGVPSCSTIVSTKTAVSLTTIFYP
jgi:hypothetical protein